MSADGRVLAIVLTVLPAIVFPVLPPQIRDGAANTAGTAMITGTIVVDDSSPKPLGRAIVTVSGAQLPESWSTIADDAGGFAIRNLPAGRFTISATKRGYVAGSYGATRPGRPGTPAQIAANQTLRVSIHLGRGAVVAGTIRDQGGTPVSDVLVFAVDARKDPSTVVDSLLTTNGGESGGVLTDDRGAYRIYGLSPGDYVVLAASKGSGLNEIMKPSASDVDAMLSRLQARAQSVTPSAAAAVPARTLAPSPAHHTLAPVYFPGTPSLDNATHLTLGFGDERTGLDFVMTSVPVTTLEGVITSDAGQPSNVRLSITPANAIHLFALASATPILTTPPDGSGRFKFSNLVPGHYVLMARANPTGDLPLASGRSAGMGNMRADGSGAGAAPDATRTVYGVEEVDINGQPISGVTIRLQPGGRFTGRIVFDAESHAVPADLTQLRLTLTPATGSGYMQSGATLIGNPFGGMGSVPIRADGSFSIPGIAPGSYRVQCAPPAAAGAGWWFRSAIVRGRDVLDGTLDVPLGADLAGAVLTLTDRHSELSGRLQTDAGLPAPNYTVLVMPADRALWITGARRVKSTRPGTDGAFAFADLPAGDYLLAALTDVEPDEWQKPEFLAEVAPHGVKVTLGVGEKKTQDLQIAR